MTKRVLLLCLTLLAVVEGSPLFNNEDWRENVLDGSETSATDSIIKINKEENNKFFEGDIVLTDHDHVDMRETGDVDGPLTTNDKRNAQRARKGLWKTKIIPYEISANMSDYVTTIQAAIAEFTQHTCIRWVSHSQETNWVKFVKKRGCWSSVGSKYWQSGFQELSLGDGCNHKGTIMHEMMHASGFWHEQSRPDRNQYVEVMWENIEAGMAHNFNKYSRGTIDDLKANYDFGSLMHYGKFGFSKNGKPTLQAIGDPNKEIGQRDGFSKTDIIEINALYDCSGPSGGWSSWSSYGPCSAGCEKARQRFCTASDKQTACPGADQHSIKTEYTKCTQAECNAPIDGHWGRWSSWSSCSKTCGEGKHTRSRKCDDPTPKNGGKDCVGMDRQSQSCKDKSCGLGPDDCEFEQGMCVWSQPTTSQENSFRWVRNSGPTGSADTGPSADHTMGALRSGYYVYSEASFPVGQDQKAYLTSKEFPATSGRCMSFYYHMYGGGMGSFNIFINDSATGALTQIFSKTGNQGNAWKTANVTVVSNGTYAVVFQSVRGIDYRGDLALDDIKFNESSCVTPPTPGPTTKQPTSKQPTTKPTTEKPTTQKPTTEKPTTQKPTTEKPTTEKPTTQKPTTEKPTTQKPTTENPTTQKPTTEKPTTQKPTTEKPTTQKPTTQKPTTEKPTTQKPITKQPTTKQPTTQKPTTQKPSTKAPTTKRPTQKPTIPTTKRPVATTTQPPACYDRNAYCPSWAAAGQCSSNPGYMLVYCKKSCKQCGSQCYDKNSNCPYWASMGQCSYNPGYMLVNCKKSCRQCGSVTCRDQYGTSWCTYYRNHCYSSSVYTYCHKTCRLCY